MIRTMTGLAVAGLVVSGCALPGPAPATDPDPAPPAEVRRFEDSGGEMRFISLEPVRVGETPTLSDRPVTLSVGALYGGPERGEDGPHTLALVLRTVTRGDAPLLTSGCGLLLDVDGTWLTSNPEPGGHIYTVEGTMSGIQETVMVPLTPDLMRKVAEADRVRGRLGPWYSFVLPRDQRRALSRILDEIPEDAVFRRSLRSPTLVASR